MAKASTFGCTSALAATMLVYPASNVAAQGCKAGESESCPIELKMARGATSLTRTDRLTIRRDRVFYSAKIGRGQAVGVTIRSTLTLVGELHCPGGDDAPFSEHGSVTSTAAGVCRISVGRNPRADGGPTTGRFTLTLSAK